MRISIIIPTHNRSQSLKNTIESIISLQDKFFFELIIVDNNSNDNTANIAREYYPFVKYIFEKNTAFSRARRAGANNASGDILLFLDDDVLVNKGSFKSIIEVFTNYPNCGVIAGRIDPQYSEKPPLWTLNCQKNFNGWSLYNSETYSFLKKNFQTVPSAAGPMMAVRKNVYDIVGGFPPDTVGVETNKGPKSFNKLYIGPGDYGLCLKIRKAGFKIYFSNNISVFHVIPAVRFTIQFWRSRIIGEGYCRAISNRGFFHYSKFKIYLIRLLCEYYFLKFEQKIYLKLKSNSNDAIIDGIDQNELRLFYYKSYLDMDFVLRIHPDLWKLLWDIGDNGVSNRDFSKILEKLPQEYKNLVSNEFINDVRPINSLRSYEKIIQNRGYYYKNQSIFFSSKIIRFIFIIIFRFKNFLNF
jgi:glycosyltransferase involved in cell wall biosynthesis